MRSFAFLFVTLTPVVLDADEFERRQLDRFKTQNESFKEKLKQNAEAVIARCDQALEASLDRALDLARNAQIDLILDRSLPWNMKHEPLTLLRNKMTKLYEVHREREFQRSLSQYRRYNEIRHHSFEHESFPVRVSGVPAYFRFTDGRIANGYLHAAPVEAVDCTVDGARAALSGSTIELVETAAGFYAYHVQARRFVFLNHQQFFSLLYSAEPNANYTPPRPPAGSGRGSGSSVGRTILGLAAVGAGLLLLNSLLPNDRAPTAATAQQPSRGWRAFIAMRNALAREFTDATVDAMLQSQFPRVSEHLRRSAREEFMRVVDRGRPDTPLSDNALDAIVALFGEEDRPAARTITSAINRFMGEYEAQNQRFD